MRKLSEDSLWRRPHDRLPVLAKDSWHMALSFLPGPFLSVSAMDRPSCIPSSYEVEFEVNKVLLTTKPEPVQTLDLGVAVDIGVAPAVDPAAKIESKHKANNAYPWDPSFAGPNPPVH
ncbi:hypothetical protein SDJN03_18691, partial [Cucurbita argyrosperma subsp. sororia]